MAKKKYNVKLKSFRTFLEPQEESDSYIRVTVSRESWENGDVSLKLTDCDRRIMWHFGPPGNPRAVAKITKLKEIVDKVYDYLTQEVE